VRVISGGFTAAGPRFGIYLPENGRPCPSNNGGALQMLGLRVRLRHRRRWMFVVGLVEPAQWLCRTKPL